MRQATVFMFVTVLLATGCGGGGGGGKRLSRQELDSKGNAICAKYNAKQKQIANPKSINDLAPALHKLLPLGKQQLAELSQLTPPKADEAAYTNLLGDVRAENDFAEHKLIPAADKGDIAAVRSYVSRLAAMDGSNNSKARALGLTTCAQSVG